MFRSFLRLLLALTVFSLVSACSGPSNAPAPVSPPNLVPYASTTPLVAPSATVQATAIPIPSATPSTYVVASGDTLSVIAQNLGISLADLTAANPGVVAESLKVGQKLNVPAAASGENAHPTPTPAAVSLGAVRCYPSGGGVYCLAPVQNPNASALEDVAVQFSLVDAQGKVAASQTAPLLLDVLPAGQALPAVAFFTAKNALSLQPVAQLVTSIQVLPGEQRYLAATTRNVLVSVDWDGRSAQVHGQVYLSADQQTAHTLWVAGVAYDAQNRPVGVHRWEWSGTLKAGCTQAFDFPVYSLGAAISQVNVLVEARP